MPQDSGPRTDSIHDAHDRPAAGPRGAERRVRRSEDPIIALHYQLAAARAEAELDAIVLVDDCGVLVAGAGAWPVCEELAAYAPLLGRPAAIHNAAVGSRVAVLAAEVEVHAVALDGCEALLCGRGAGGKRGEAIRWAASGCRRILGAAVVAAG